MDKHILLSPEVTEPFILTATVAPDEERLRFWPRYFGSIPQWITLEPRVFAWMDRLCAGYSGGIWDFYTLSNGGAFMAPEVEEEAPCCCSTPSTAARLRSARRPPVSWPV